MARKKISIITPCYNEEANLKDCYNAIKDLFEGPLGKYDREHIFCDNASTDGTVAALREIASGDRSVKVIVNARNYGPFRSTFNGLRHASGDAVIVLFAADLQDPPEIIPLLVSRWEKGFEVVYGVRAKRQESSLLRAIRKIYYRTVSRVADINIPLDAGEFQLIDKRVHAALMQHDDYYPYIRGMIANCGFNAVGVDYEWKARKKGLSKNRIHHLIDQGLNGLISFTNLPMRIAMFAGLTIAIASFLYVTYTIIAHIVAHGALAQPGVTTLIVGIFFFGGIQLTFLGVIGEYIAAIHQQVRKRPLVVERELINCDELAGRNRAD